MSFKDTVLPDFVIAALYPTTLTGDRAESGGMPGLKPDSAVSLKESAAVAKQAATATEPIRLTPMDEQPAEESIAVLPGSAKETSLPYKYLGKNLRKVSVIARYKDDPYIPEDHLQFLIKILAACKLNLGDVAILNDAVAAIQIGKLKSELNPSFVLLFDVEPSEIGLPLSFPAMKAQSFDGCSFVVIPSIETLVPDTDAARALKKQLWECLKKMFAV